MLGFLEFMLRAGNASVLGIGDRVGPYRILREIGRGAMAVVFEASAPGGRNVALKVLLPEIEDAAEIVARFEREGRILQALRHENIARVFDVGTLPNGTLYLVIELLEGEDLRATLETAAPLPIATAVRYVLGASRGAAEAHSQGIVHRDLKPANLFLARDARGRRVVKILDFGVAKVLGGVESATRAREVIGSPVYAAPEQLASSKAVRPQTDVWALGVVLYQALTDTRPFDGSTIGALVAAIRDHTPRPIRAVRPDCPPALEAIVRRCLSKDPDSRFATAHELAEALEPFARESIRSSVPSVADDGDDEDATILNEGTRMMPAARELQQRSAIASLGALPKASDGSPEAARTGRRRAAAGGSGAGRLRGAFMLVAAVGLLLGVGGAYLATQRGWGAPSSQTVKLRVTTQPEGASFSVDYGPQMTAPADLSLAKDERVHVLLVWKDGYRPERRELTVTSEATLDIPLLPAEP